MLYHQLLSTSSNNGTPGRVSDTHSSRPDSRSGSRRASHAEHGDTPPLGRPSSSSSFSLSMSGPAAMSLYGDLFRWYDRNKSGALETDELQVISGRGAGGLCHLVIGVWQGEGCPAQMDLEVCCNCNAALIQGAWVPLTAGWGR